MTSPRTRWARSGATLAVGLAAALAAPVAAQALAGGEDPTVVESETLADTDDTPAAEAADGADAVDGNHGAAALEHGRVMGTPTGSPSAPPTGAVSPGG